MSIFAQVPATALGPSFKFFLSIFPFMSWRTWFFYDDVTTKCCECARRVLSGGRAAILFSRGRRETWIEIRVIQKIPRIREGIQLYSPIPSGLRR